MKKHIRSVALLLILSVIFAYSAYASGPWDKLNGFKHSAADAGSITSCSLLELSTNFINWMRNLNINPQTNNEFGIPVGDGKSMTHFNDICFIYYTGSMDMIEATVPFVNYKNKIPIEDSYRILALIAAVEVGAPKDNSAKETQSAKELALDIYGQIFDNAVALEPNIYDGNEYLILSTEHAAYYVSFDVSDEVLTLYIR